MKYVCSGSRHVEIRTITRLLLSPPYDDLGPFRLGRVIDDLVVSKETTTEVSQHAELPATVELLCPADPDYVTPYPLGPLLQLNNEPLSSIETDTHAFRLLDRSEPKPNLDLWILPPLILTHSILPHVPLFRTQTPADRPPHRCLDPTVS